MSNDLAIEKRTVGDVTVLDLVGDLTAVSGQALEDAYRKISGEPSTKILLHFSQEHYINSGGIAFMIGIAAEGKDKGQVIRISGLSDHFRKIFDMMGLTRYVEIFSTERDALEGF